MGDFIRSARTGDFFTAQDFPDKLRAAFPGSDRVNSLLSAAKKWTSGRYQTVRHDAAEILAGRTGSAEAKALLETIDASPASSPALFRGLAQSQSPEYVAAQWAENTTFQMALGSFTSDVKIATKFARTARAKANTELIIRLEKGSKALKLEGMVGKQAYWKEREWLGSGRYRVVKVTKAGNRVTVTIRQEATYG